MRRLVVGLAFLALAATTFSWALADDQEIARKVKDRLQQEQKDGNLRSFDINLKVVEGKVTLKGSVASAEQKELAVGLARQVDGVKDIEDDDLQVKAATVKAGSSGSSGVSSAASAPARKTLLSSLFRSTSTRKASEADPEQEKSSKPAESTKPATSSTVAPAVVPTVVATVAVAAEPTITPAASAAEQARPCIRGQDAGRDAGRRRSPDW